jgi:hypothetical protein
MFREETNFSGISVRETAFHVEHHTQEMRRREGASEANLFGFNKSPEKPMFHVEHRFRDPSHDTRHAYSQAINWEFTACAHCAQQDTHCLSTGFPSFSQPDIHNCRTTSGPMSLQYAGNLTHYL